MVRAKEEGSFQRSHAVGELSDSSIVANLVVNPGSDFDLVVLDEDGPACV